MRFAKQLFVIIALALIPCSNAKDKEVQIEKHLLTEQIYMLSGQCGNIGLFIVDDTVFMIDDQFRATLYKILNAK